MSTSGEKELVRAVGLGGLTAGIVNVTIGAGIFALPGLVAADLGAAAPIAYVVCAGAMLLVVLTFAEAGSRVSNTGGLYAYAETVFGPFVGFLLGVLLWLGAFALASASVANIFVATVGELIPGARTPAVRVVLLAAMYTGLAIVNVRGVRSGTRVVETMTIAKLAPLLLLIIVGIVFVSAANLTWPGIAAGQIGKTAIVLIFAFLGIEVALTPSGEVKNPSRTVPRAVLLALGVVTLVYILLQVVAQGVLGTELASNRTAPLAAVATRIIGEGGRIFVLIGAAISTLGYVSGDMLASPRALFALGRVGTLPRVLASVHPRYRTPYVAIIVHAIVAFAFAVSGSFEQLVIVVNLAALSVYLVSCIATIELQRRNVRTQGEPFRLPGGPVIPLLASLVIIWLMSNATRREFAALAIMVGASAAVYGIRALVVRRSTTTRR